MYDLVLVFPGGRMGWGLGVWVIGWAMGVWGVGGMAKIQNTLIVKSYEHWSSCTLSVVDGRHEGSNLSCCSFLIAFKLEISSTTGVRTYYLEKSI